MKRRGYGWCLMILLVAPVLSRAQCAPPSSLTQCAPPSGLTPTIEKRWVDLCNAAGTDVLGQPKSTSVMPHLASGGHYQDFDRGQIAVFPRWAGKPAATMPSFVLSAHDASDGKIHVQWDSTAPYEYEFFNIRWDSDDHDEAISAQHAHQDEILGIGGSDPQQIEIEGQGTCGAAVIQAGHSTQRIYIEVTNTPSESYWLNY